MDTKNHLKCTDCAHVRNGGPINTFFARLARMQYGWQCGLVSVKGEFNPVNGVQEPDTFMMCGVERGQYGRCGPRAVNWTPRRKQDLFKLLARKEV
jgi:hypothetical protein